MHCKIDENMPIDVADLLRQAGHDCHTVYDEGLSGAVDATVFARCQAEQRVLITLDLDFADIRAYPPADTAGIVVLRPGEPDRERVLRIVARILPLFSGEPIGQRLWVVEEDRVRIRRSDGPAV